MSLPARTSVLMCLFAVTAAGAPSAVRADERLPMVTIVPPGDVFAPESWDRIVILSCDIPGAMIRFTTDDTEPTEESPLYGEPFAVGPDTHLKAKAFKPSWGPSETTVAMFTNERAAGEVSEKVAILRGGTSELRAVGSSLTFDLISYDTFAKIVWSATNAATWHDPNGRSEPALDIDSRVQGFVTIDERAASTLFTTIDQIERALPDGWQLVEVALSDPGLHKVLVTMSEGMERARAIKLRPHHLHQVHYRFEHR